MGKWPDRCALSQINDRQIVPAPVIKAAGKTFRERLGISFETNRSDQNVHYTTNGRKPDRRAPLFTKPFLIDRTTTVKAIAIDRDGETSLIATATYHRIPRNWSIKLLSKYSLQYPGGGDLALIDGVRGTTNFSDGGWQGYQGQDLIAVVDLGQVQTISKLGAGFLQDIGSWIWMPRQVDFEISSDGECFVPIFPLPNDMSDRHYGSIIKDFVGTVQPREGRYVKIIARNYGKLPTWHPGAGGDAWIFVDEIIINDRNNSESR